MRFKYLFKWTRWKLLKIRVEDPSLESEDILNKLALIPRSKLERMSSADQVVVSTLRQWT